MFSWRALVLLLVGGARASVRQPGPLLFTLTGMTLATALVVGVDLANSAARRGYEASFARLNAGVTHVVLASSGVLRDADYLRLRNAWRSGQLRGVRAIAPMLIGSVEVRQPRAVNGTGDTLTTRELWGIDPLQDGNLRSSTAHQLSLGNAPSLLSERGLFVLGTDSAGAASTLRPGSVALRVAASPYTQLIGPKKVAEAARAPWQVGRVLAVAAGLPGAPGILLADIATAQEVLGMSGRLTRIDLQLDCGPAPQQTLLQRSISTLFPGLAPRRERVCTAEAGLRLPPGLRLQSLAAQRDEDLSAAAAFEFNLGALSLLAAAVAAFLVHQVVLLGVHRQTVAFGRLRALGMLGSEIAVRLVFGYVGIAAIGGALGVLLGGVLAQAMVASVSGVVNDLFYRVTVTHIDVDVASACKGMAVAVGVALLSSIGPALRLARTPPVQLINGELRARAARAVPWFSVLCALGVVLALRGTDATWGALLAIGLSLLASLGLAARLLPRVQPSQRMPVLPRLALADLARTGRDAGLALGALVIAVATAFGMAWMISSFRLALEDVLDARLAADLIVRVDAVDSARLPLLARLPGVSRMSTAGRDEVRVEDLRTALRVVDDGVAEGARTRLPATAFAAAQVTLSEPLAHRLGKRVGDHVRIGSCNLRVGGVFKEYGSVQGRLAATRSTLAPCLALPVATEAELWGRVDAAQVRAALAGARDPLVAAQAGIRAYSLAIFDRTFTVTRVVRWLALLVAAIALFASLSIWMTQRAAELGTLRALGLTGTELGLMLAMQTLLLGVMAILLALPLGALIAWILSSELQPRAFGWSFPLQLDFASIEGTLAAALVAVVAGAALPVLSLARSPSIRWLQQARHG